MREENKLKVPCSVTIRPPPLAKTKGGTVKDWQESGQIIRVEVQEEDRHLGGG